MDGLPQLDLETFLVEKHLESCRFPESIDSKKTAVGILGVLDWKLIESPVLGEALMSLRFSCFLRLVFLVKHVQTLFLSTQIFSLVFVISMSFLVSLYPATVLFY